MDNHHQDHPHKKSGGHQHAVSQKLHAAHRGHGDTQGHQPHPAGHDGHGQHANHNNDFLRRFWVSLILTVPILLLSPMIQHWLGVDWRFAADSYILLGLGTALYFYGGWPFLKGMIGEIKGRSIGMMTLVGLAISVAFLYSAAVVAGLKGMDFFWELATLIDIMLLGHWIEMRSQAAASRSLQSLVALLPSVVHIERDGQLDDASLQDLRRGDTILIKPGEKVPADGNVVDGESYVNESMLTGESVPVPKGKGGKVIAGAINGDGLLRVRVTGTGKDSYLNKVISMVESAQQVKSRTQNLADRVAKWLTYVSILTGLVTFVFWMLAGQGMAFGLERMVTVMVTACPHALGVAIPLVVAISTSVSATQGLLIRNRTAFENSRNLSTVLFDKTGTLTRGSHEVKEVVPLLPPFSREEVLQYSAALQQHSEHHIAKGVMAKLRQENLPLWENEGFQNIRGMGVTGKVKGRQVAAAGPNYLHQYGIGIPALPAGADPEGVTISYVVIDGVVAGIITLADQVRENSGQAIQSLKEMNIKSYLITGDNEKVAAKVAEELGMEGWLANVLPHEKQEKVKAFQAKGEIVAMTGDGVNDAPALAQADVGIAVGSGTDVAAETADIILVNSDPLDVVKIISFGKATYRKMIQNLLWAAGYNVVAIPLAAGVLYPHFLLSPAMGAVLMSLSTIIVAINARFLKLK